ncbi:hypothetical protein [Tenacibaculum finnmarkense]|uniref:hypothetical protein n=1 Tax=Tenacibaculum finnmarkense TaxID=2781243 RepID=UPI00187BAEE1|nr:hypothetical protein [Tenacibaculum finnmarkense]MBE7660301.1 hypothetical protein [Tenacibaculum finnmarkense genomovar finnmarkense]MCG8185391.1 hypothetical protein [Tenacibaculum finnmarkense genomovar finnmarkense]MCG8251989.1 hypothetical protein [Tenacibaculum finnmarkense genomovar finnmarkense]MCG8792541.1 hypothetical protein [Tenacibaculum finnmarkense]MCG8815518.1 hypothetical protein [Tenacibaculum finnmarkense]
MKTSLNTSSNLLQKHSKIAIGYFILIAFLGVLLRVFAVIDLPINYRFMVHAHSHVALLGWVYTALTTLIFKLYLDKKTLHTRYKQLFWATQITIIGMLISFPFTGYAFFSIVFSTLFLIASYFFGYLFFKHSSTIQKQTNSYKCIRIALWFMIISSLGPWALGIIIKTVGSGSSLYRNAIYFYLHFQYNGWFILALFGVFFYILEKHKIILPKKIFNRFFWMLNIGVILTFGISLLWDKPSFILYLIASFGALLQGIAFYILSKHLLADYQKIKNIFSPVLFKGLKVVVLLFMMKLIFQFVGTLPYFSAVIFSNIDFIIGYLHFNFLGIVSISLLVFLQQFQLIQLSKKSLLFYIIGFLLTEIVIFYKGIVVWLNIDLINYYPEYLVAVSLLFLVAIAVIFSQQFKKKQAVKIFSQK